jgi:hypothetical protein
MTDGPQDKDAGTPAKKPGRRRHPALNVRIPFFIPLWRRVLTVALIAGWAGVELFLGNPYWAMLAGGIGLFIAYEFFVGFDAEDFARGED